MTLAAGSATLLPSCRNARGSGDNSGGRLLALAFDGLDPRITRRLINAGKAPNLARLAEQGSFQPLATSTPPQTPVAFGSIISGADPGTHQIFDFIHRDPNPKDSSAFRVYTSTADTLPPANEWAISLGRWRLPLNGPATVSLRRGPAFWEYLVRAGVDTDIYFMPSTYPTRLVEGPGRFRCVGGMGVPDLLGSLGEFTFFTPDAPPQGKRVSGGRFVHLAIRNHQGAAKLEGPANFLLKPDPSGVRPPLTVDLHVVRDPEYPVAKVQLGRHACVLNQGDWSDWIPIEFPSGIPASSVLAAVGAPTSVRGMVRLFLKQVHPKLELYVSPLNIDPEMPATPISTPESFAAALAEAGRFHTIGIPEDTKALTHGALDEDQFLDQAELVLQEHLLHFRKALAEFDRGCLFFYFGTPDLLQHMFYRDYDPEHPGRVPEEAARYEHVVEDAYVRMDKIVGEALRQLQPQDTFMAFSDHGFTTFRRGFSLNTWLLQNDYIRLINPFQAEDPSFDGVRWDRTLAYGLGMNGLYLNLRGREKYGVVETSEWRGLAEHLRDMLMQVRDETGRSVVRRVDLVEDLYPDADPLISPDLIVGYAEGYRVGWESVLGGMPRAVTEDNMRRWSGTHLIAADQIPGILATNRRVIVDNPSLRDIAPTILSVFGINKPPAMTGRPLFSSHRSQRSRISERAEPV